MALSSLVVCAEDEAVAVLSRVLQDLDIKVEISRNPQALLASPPGRRFDAVVVDCQEQASALPLIAHFRQTSENGQAVVIALVNSQADASEVFGRGANFLLYKPVSRERALDSLRAARGMMRQERRIEPRIPVQASAALAFPGKENAEATLVELSESGVGLRTQDQLPPACKAYLQFSLPESQAVVRLAGEVMWQDKTGRVGIRLVSVPPTSRRLLHRWLQEHEVADSAPEEVLQPEARNPGLAAGTGALPASASDRRNRERRACSLGADVYREDAKVPHRSTLSDISTGGCYVETPEPFPQGTVLTIVVRTPDAKLCVTGKVESMHLGYGMGVRFTLTNDGERTRVRQLIACAESKPQGKV
jgi:CheY-like chemotaxis protein